MQRVFHVGLTGDGLEVIPVGGWVPRKAKLMKKESKGQHRTTKAVELKEK